jgi:putative hemolysin
VSDDQSMTECLERLMREHTHIALVRDAQGRVAGLVSLEDIIEVLVGEIEDEYDRLPTNITPSGSSWVAGGGVSLDRLKAATGVDLTADAPTATVHTLSEWVVGHLGREARGGDAVERNGVRVAVRKVRRQKVQEAQINHLAERRAPAPAHGPTGAR